MIRRPFFLAAPFLLALALAACANPSPDVAEEAIVNGTLGGDPAVVWVYSRDSGGLCTGTLIEPRVVLTAKHCVQEAGASGPSSASAMVAGIGDRAGSGRTLRVQSVYTTPGSYRDDGRLSGLVGQDVAVLVLVSGVTDVEPIPVRRTPPDDLRGQTVTAIGFGQIPSGSSGTKYTATGDVTYVADDVIYVGSLICQGDSGGPMVTEDREVAAVVSFGNGSCGSGQGGYNAIYNFLDLIDMAIEEGGGCVNDGAEVCDGRDNDCNGAVDEGCTPIGGNCASDDICVGNTCRDTIAGRICTEACDARRPDFGCGEGFYCARDAATSCGGYCVPRTGDASLANDRPCERDDQCASFFCTDPGDGIRRCLTPCQGDAGMCLAGEACVAGPGACGACVDADLVGGLRAGLGEPCGDAADCASGSCIEDGDARYCSRACDGETGCPGGYHCRDAMCVRGTLGGIGETCVNNADCGSGTFCAVQGDRAWCTSICGSEEQCPDGFACVAAGGVMVCAPEVGLVGDACVAGTDCFSGVCGDDGVCTRECGVDAPCGPGFECRRGADGMSAACIAPRAETSGGGCAVGSGARRPGATTMLVLVAIGSIVIARRRRRG
ncbi:S1 family peptidase [Sandaracinus amylolyticus]|uniref:S1 family peptidase n=1 Tax=Sandaracinus amylolyticus TaxID=927083 RepID=UPI001F1AF42B|nr:S1 family peptidase [Sandaracinus amylolyticus]UJR82753.1 Hypothetical protein I5071_48180 [Sandaracinus amylolyticus]